MSFKPFSVYVTRLPVLKAGHIIHTGPDFASGYLQVTTVRNNRKKVSITGAKTTLYDLVITTDTSFESLHGNLKKNRIVHLQYLGLGTTASTYLWWLTTPLLSKDVDEAITSAIAPIDQPIEIDRWSYDESQYLRIKQSADQDYYFVIVEYEVTGYPTKPDKPFLHIFANGQAQFVTEGALVAGLGKYERQALRELEKIRAMRRVE
jgi:hypothetical protein